MGEIFGYLVWHEYNTNRRVRQIAFQFILLVRCKEYIFDNFPETASIVTVPINNERVKYLILISMT